MAIYVKCSSCGEIYNELTTSQCPKCGCGQAIKLKYNKQYELVEDEEQDLRNSNESEAESESNHQEPEREYIPQTPFPFTEVPVLFANVYEHFFKKDKEIKFWRLLLIFLIELAIGILIVLIGYFISLELDERAHRLGFDSRGGSRGGSIFMIIGVAAYAHAFYSIVKYSTLYIIGKRNSLMSESKVRLVLFLVVFLLGSLITGIDAFISRSPEWKGDTEETITMAIGFIGFGLIIGSVWSLIKYIIMSRRKNKI